MTPWTLVEPCAGTAALSLHLLGAKRNLLPYQGSKWRFRHVLAAIAQSLGFKGAPSRVVLTDAGPFGKTMGEVLRARRRKDLLDRLRAYLPCDPREIWDGIQGTPPGRSGTLFAAEHLFLQRLAFSGKAVGIRKGVWSSPGFNKTSAYGIPATKVFGRVSPMIPSLVKVLESYDEDLAKDVRIESKTAFAKPPTEPRPERTLVYIDPNYRGVTSYPNGFLTRAEVVELAVSWRSMGAAVLVSEAEAVEELVLQGWSSVRMSVGRDDTSPFRGKAQEWVTYCRSES